MSDPPLDLAIAETRDKGTAGSHGGAQVAHIERERYIGPRCLNR